MKAGKEIVRKTIREDEFIVYIVDIECPHCAHVVNADTMICTSCGEECARPGGSK